jgi:hypothetical protein
MNKAKIEQNMKIKKKNYNCFVVWFVNKTIKANKCTVMLVNKKNGAIK